jgi:hypothetical protein
MLQIKQMRYKEIYPMDRRQLETLFESGNNDAMIDALLSAAYYDPDWRWVQGISLRFLDHADVGVRSNAATCLGHIARIHRKMDLELVLPKLIEMQSDPAIRAWVEDALADIRFFLGVH